MEGRGISLTCAVVVDVDNTLISTDRRMQAIWKEALQCDVPLEAVETLGMEQIFMKYASTEQKSRVGELQRRFWEILLCCEPVGIELLNLHEPLPFAAEILRKWSRNCELVYLTGRTRNTRDLTLGELRRFGFPTKNVMLVMFSFEDYSRARGENPSGPTLIDAKRRLFSKVSQNHSVVRVVDDYPGYFNIFKEFKVPDRIGLLRPKRYRPQDYFERGATRVIESWRQLEDDPPEPV